MSSFLPSCEGQRVLKILPLGESTTEGTVDFAGGYRGVLREKLVMAGIPVDFVGSRTENSKGLTDPEHEGHPGYRIDWLRTGKVVAGLSSADPVEIMLERFKPDVVLLLMGTNNLYVDPAASAAGEMKALLEGIFRAMPMVTVILGGITPILPGPKPWNCTVPEDVTQRVRDYNHRLAALARSFRSENRAIVYVDHSPCVTGPADLMADGVHPTAVVMQRMAETWLGALTGILRSAASRVDVTNGKFASQGE
jgi:lysophospholipase L1-like esterase